MQHNRNTMIPVSEISDPSFEELLRQAERVQLRPGRRTAPRELQFVGKLRKQYEDWGDAAQLSQAELDWLEVIAKS